MTDQFVIACSTPWFARIEKTSAFANHSFTYVSRREDLTIDFLTRLEPRYVFFPHWNWLVPPAIIDAFECVCFHATPLPYGRGGSPIQNMIVRGHTDTKVTALRMTDGVDEGPIYLQRDASLAGTADEIFTRVSLIIQDMIVTIIQTSPVPCPQVGEPTVFKRRTPAQSVLLREGSLSQVYDHIRMLDGEGYPKAFLTHGDFVIEFDSAHEREGHLEARAIIRTRRAE